MIKSIVKFIEGTVYSTNETNKVIYLSDGTHWHKQKFHSNCNLIRAYMNREVAMDKNIQALTRMIEDRKKVLEQKLRECLDPLYIIEHSKVPMRFGKYKGKRLSWIFENDIGYVKWLLSLDNFKLDLLLEKGEQPVREKVDPPPPMIYPFDNSNKSDDLLL